MIARLQDGSLARAFASEPVATDGEPAAASVPKDAKSDPRESQGFDQQGNRAIDPVSDAPAGQGTSEAQQVGGLPHNGESEPVVVEEGVIGDAVTIPDEPSRPPAKNQQHEKPAAGGDVGEGGAVPAPEIPEPSVDTQEAGPDNGGRSLLAGFLKRGDFGAAHWAAVALGDRSPLPVWFVDLLQLGLKFNPSFPSGEEELGTLFAEASQAIPDGQAQVTLLAAACVKPALFAPHTYPVLVLEQLQGRAGFLPELAVVVSLLADFARKNIPLEAEMVHGIETRENWEEEHRRLVLETDDWVMTAPKRQTVMRRANVIWSEWTKPGGLLRALLERMKSNKIDLAEAKAEIDEWRDRASFTRLLDRTDNELERTVGHSARPLSRL